MATETLRPNAAGDRTEAESQFPTSGSHYDKVDEIGSGDGDTTYVQSYTNNGVTVDLYNLPAHSGVGPINKITVYARIKGNTTGGLPPPAYQIYIKTGGSEYSTASVNISVSTYVLYSNEWATNPKTSANWTWSDIDALQIGFSLAGYWNHPRSTLTRCTQCWVEVDYTPYTDIGLRIRTSGGTKKIGAQALSGHKLRIRKGGTTYGIPLITPGDANDSGVRIYDGSTVKALPEVT